MKEFEVIELVEGNYSLKVIKLLKIKNVYRLQCNEGEFCLKVVHYEFKHFYFILEAMKHLIKNGFEHVEEIIKNNSGGDYIKFEKGYAYVTKWICARECNYDNPLDVILAGTTLAELHKKSENYIVTQYMEPRYNWKKWIEVFETRIEEINDFNERIEGKSNKKEFDFKFKEILKEEISRGKEAIEHLKSTKYLLKMEEEIKKNGFCHHDYAHHNVLVDRASKVWIIDFDYCILDTHLHDLASFLIRTMKNGKWSIRKAQWILQLYSELYKVEEEDIAIMAAFVEFPQEFWQIGIQYYWEKQPWQEENFLSRLNRIYKDREERQEFVNEFRELKYGQ